MQMQSLVSAIGIPSAAEAAQPAAYLFEHSLSHWDQWPPVLVEVEAVMLLCWVERCFVEVML
jgi:hypothetical protein